MYRKTSLRQLADRLQFSFSEADDFGLMAQLDDFKLFSSGYRRELAHILRRQSGLMEFDLSIFDYRYTPYGASKDRTVYQTVFYIQSANLGLPEMHLEPETLVHKLGELIGFHDIDFVRFPKFSGQYRLTGADEEYIRHHFTDDVLNYFTLNKGWTVEGLGFYLLLYKKGTLLPAEEIESFYRKGMEVYELLSNEENRQRILGA